jgi:hypothetical protein
MKADVRWGETQEESSEALGTLAAEALKEQALGETEPLASQRQWSAEPHDDFARRSRPCQQMCSAA